MSHVTSDLDFFKCDMCGVYMHKDLYCDHRRVCKGRDSVELTKKQAADVADVLDAAERNALVGTGTVDKAAVCLPVEEQEKRQLSDTRTRLQEEYYAEKRKEEASKPRMSTQDALAFLEADD